MTITWCGIKDIYWQNSETNISEVRYTTKIMTDNTIMNIQIKAVLKKYGGKTEHYCDIEGCEKIAPHITTLNHVDPNELHHFCPDHFKTYFTDAYCISPTCQNFRDIESKNDLKEKREKVKQILKEIYKRCC